MNYCKVNAELKQTYPDTSGINLGPRGWKCDVIRYCFSKNNVRKKKTIYWTKFYDFLKDSWGNQYAAVSALLRQWTWIPKSCLLTPEHSKHKNYILLISLCLCFAVCLLLSLMKVWRWRNVSIICYLLAIIFRQLILGYLSVIRTTKIVWSNIFLPVTPKVSLCDVTMQCNTILKHEAKKIITERWKQQKSSDRHQLLWFLSGLIYSLLMLIWVLAAFSPCEFSYTFTSLLCLWLCIQTSSRWGLLSAFHCIPHWFGLVCELRRPPPGSVQSESLFRLQAVGLKQFRCPLWLFSEPEEMKTVW